MRYFSASWASIPEDKCCSKNAETKSLSRRFFFKNSTKFAFSLAKNSGCGVIFSYSVVCISKLIAPRTFFLNLNSDISYSVYYY